jgi:hypothetical protein
MAYALAFYLPLSICDTLAIAAAARKRGTFSGK